MDERETVSRLMLSSKRVGRFYPVILDAHGNVVDGLHRLKADPNWPKIRLDHIKCEEDKLIARLIANVCRRNISAKEKREMIRELGDLYVKAGVKPGTELANKISEKTGMSYRWVMKYLPDDLKERPGIGGPSRRFNSTKVRRDAVAGCGTLQIEFLQLKPIKKVMTVRKYTNVDFVQVILDKQFYAAIEGVAEKLGTAPDVILNNALIWAVNKLIQVLSQTNRLFRSTESIIELWIRFKFYNEQRISHHINVQLPPQSVKM